MTTGHRSMNAWSDAELDHALECLRREAEPSHADLSAARSAVIGAARNHEPAATVPRRGRWRRPALIAATVVVLAAVGLTVPLLRGPEASPAAAASLNRAADAADRAAKSGADVIPAGHYRYTATDAWYLSMSSEFTYLAQSRQQVWMPADWHDTWLERRSTTGARKWIHGNERDAVAQGLAKDGTPSVEPDLRGPCADYFTNVCDGPGSWQTPTKQWIAALPSDPAKLYQLLSKDSEGRGQSHEAEMLVQATDALRTGLLPAAVRANLYRAMAKIGGVRISEDAVTLDNTTGIGFSVDSPWIREETIIDPDTGDYIGTRQVIIKDDTVNHIPAGTLMGYTAVHSTIVDRLGATG